MVCGFISFSLSANKWRDWAMMCLVFSLMLARAQVQLYDQVKGVYLLEPQVNPIQGCVHALEVELTNVQLLWYGDGCDTDERVYQSGTFSLSADVIRVALFAGQDLLFRYQVNSTHLVTSRTTAPARTLVYRKQQPQAVLDGVWRVASRAAINGSSSNSNSSSSSFGLLRINSPVMSVLDPLQAEFPRVPPDVPARHGGFQGNRTFTVGPDPRAYAIEFGGLTQRSPASELDGSWAGLDAAGYPKMIEIQAGVFRFVSNRSNVYTGHILVFPGDSTLRLRGAPGRFASVNFSYSVNSTTLQLETSQAIWVTPWVLSRVSAPANVVELTSLNSEELASFLSGAGVDPSLYTTVVGADGCSSLFLSDDPSSGASAALVLQSATLTSCNPGLTTPAIVGVAVGSVLVFLAIVLIIPLSIRRLARRKEHQLRMETLERKFES